jgi:hypothetical protein
MAREIRKPLRQKYRRRLLKAMYLIKYIELIG